LITPANQSILAIDAIKRRNREKPSRPQISPEGRPNGHPKERSVAVPFLVLRSWCFVRNTDSNQEPRTKNRAAPPQRTSFHMPAQIIKIEMPFEEFEVMEHRLGYKHEYWDGMARLSPNHGAVAEMHLQVPRLLNTPALKSGLFDSTDCGEVVPADRSELIRLFQRAFDNDAEYCGYDEREYRDAAAKSIDRSLLVGDETNTDLRYSRLLRCRGDLVGALLVTTDRQQRKVIGPLMVDPTHLRSGIASRLLRETCIQLAANSIDTIHSHCHLANRTSLAWHSAMGFSRRLSWLAAAHLMRHHQQNATHQRHCKSEALACLHDELYQAYRQLHDLLYDRLCSDSAADK